MDSGIILSVLMSISGPELECLAKNIYFESRNQSHLGQLAVGQVTLNRVDDPRYPNTICEVVKQGHQNADGSMQRHRCQFSWYCDGLPDTPLNEEMWIQSYQMAYESAEYFYQGIDLTNGSTHYHTTNVNPHWAPSLTKTMRVDDHIFYRWD